MLDKIIPQLRKFFYVISFKQAIFNICNGYWCINFYQLKMTDPTTTEPSSLPNEQPPKKDEAKSSNLFVKPSEQIETAPPQGYKFIKTIGDGSFGKVKLGIHILTEQKVAIKILCKERIRERTDIQRISRQIKIMKIVRHPFIVQMYEIIESPKFLFLVMEYIEGGDLFDEISNSSKLQEEKCKKIFSQILLGLDYLHNLGITHRDMKPQNILIEASGKIKIADFGLGNFFTEGQKLKTACGSPCYAPPEMLNQEEYNPRKVDIWSSGIILYAMVHGYLPFEDDVTSLLYEKIKTKNVRVASWVSIPCRNLLRGLLAKNQEERWDIESIKKHEFLYEQVQQEEKYVIKEIQEINIEEYQNICDHLGIEQQQRLLNSLKKNKHNNLTTLFYLGKKKYLREREKEENIQSSIISEGQSSQIQVDQQHQTFDENRNKQQQLQVQKNEKEGSKQQIESHQNIKEVDNYQCQKLEGSITMPQAIMDAPIPHSLQESIVERQPPKEIPKSQHVHEENIIKKKEERLSKDATKSMKLPTKSLNSPTTKKNINPPQENLKKTEKTEKAEKNEKKEDKNIKVPSKGLKKSERMPIYKPKEETSKNNQAEVKLYERSHSKDRPIILKNHLKTQSSTNNDGYGSIIRKVVHIEPHLLDVDRIVLCSGERLCQILQKKGFNGRLQYYIYEKQAIFIAKMQLKSIKNPKGNPNPIVEKIITQINQCA